MDCSVQLVVLQQPSQACKAKTVEVVEVVVGLVVVVVVVDAVTDGLCLKEITIFTNFAHSGG